MNKIKEITRIHKKKQDCLVRQGVKTENNAHNYKMQCCDYVLIIEFENFL